MELIDTHCHLQFKDYPQPNKVVAAAAQQGVNKLICPGTTLADSLQGIELAAKFKTIWAAVGIHPHDASDYLNNKTAEKHFKQLLTKPKVVAIGEIGLDFYKNYSAREDQVEVLKQLLGLTVDS